MIGPGAKTTAQRNVIFIVVDKHALAMHFDISSFVDKAN